MAFPRVVIDKELPLNFEGYLFNDLKQAQKQASGEFHFFHFPKEGVAQARFNLFIAGSEGKSPLRAPFGSVEFHSRLSREELDYFLKEIEAYCLQKNLKKLTIISYPECYDENNSSLLNEVLLKNGYNVITRDLNFHLTVSGKYEDKLHVSERRRLKKSENAHFTFNLLQDMKEVYALIRDSRLRKGFPISMEEQELQGLFREFPQNYFCFTLWDKEVLVASAIGVRVCSRILYYFLPADHYDYRMLSPMVLLIKQMYAFCEQEGYQMLDLGIATAQGLPNPGLIRFKENLGGIPSAKLTFQKKWS